MHPFFYLHSLVSFVQAVALVRLDEKCPRGSFMFRSASLSIALLLVCSLHFDGLVSAASGAMDFASINGPMYQEMRKHLIGRRVWLAASTHPGEEEGIMQLERNELTPHDSHVSISLKVIY